ncbi:hypothetical protein D3C87_1692190 [compost metagenome]
MSFDFDLLSMGALTFGLDMDRQCGAGNSLFDRIFQAVADIMCLTDRHRSRYDQMKIDEGGRSCPPGSEVMNPERTSRMRRDRIAHRRFFIRLQRLVHQPAK